MRWKVATCAVLIAGAGLAAAGQAAAAPLNYGHCVSGGTVTPAEGVWGPYNDALYWRFQDEGVFKESGSLKAWQTSGGHSRFVDGGFWVCPK